MEKILLNHKTLTISLPGVLIIILLHHQVLMGQTDIAKWQYGKKGAVSITYDDGSINQFVKAVPIMNQLNMPGTFFIITGKIPGSKYQAKFIGRPVKEIIDESKTVPTTKDNFYERASAARFLGFKGTAEYFTKAGGQIDAGRNDQAYKTIDELYLKVNNGEFQAETETGKAGTRGNILTWDMVKTCAARGHEFGSHMVDHPYLGALDELNMIYELEKSREDLLTQLGPEYTFSAETPYCSQDERVLKNASRFYPAVRSSLTDEFFRQIRFSDHKTPVDQASEYVQWQRGTYTKIPLSVYKAWVDTTVSQKNIWLVLIIHGLDGIGWESVKSQEIDEYFRYIKSKDSDLWIATYGDVTRYIRERNKAGVKSSETKKMITVTLTHSLDKSVYDLPLTLKTVVRPEWKEVTVKQGSNVKRIKTQHDGNVTYILYQALPNTGIIEITG
jgi:peptidoglycan/xylan/chitin deacetylase (PgdA/CDA1 family)